MALLDVLIASTKGDSMTITEELMKLDAPRNVMDAGEECQKCLEAGMRPPQGLVAYIERWVYRQRSNDRYGK